MRNKSFLSWLEDKNEQSPLWSILLLIFFFAMGVVLVAGIALLTLLTIETYGLPVILILGFVFWKYYKETEPE